MSWGSEENAETEALRLKLNCKALFGTDLSLACVFLIEKLFLFVSACFYYDKIALAALCIKKEGAISGIPKGGKGYKYPVCYMEALLHQAAIPYLPSGCPGKQCAASSTL